MIAHMSIPATKPRETAIFFAALIGGLAFEFPVVPGAWIAVAKDRSGVAVEVYPDTMAHHPGKGDVDPGVKPAGPVTQPWEDQIFADGRQDRPSGFHMAITSSLPEAELLARAKAAGWRALACDRAGVFGVVEVWVDNRFLVEVLVPAEAKRYLAFMNVEGCTQFFGPGVTPERLAVAR